MRGSLYMFRYSIIFILLLVSNVVAFAQNVVFSTNVSSEKIGQQDQLQVSYTIQNAVNLQTLTPVKLNKDFKILAGPFQSQNSEIRYVNGRTSQSVSLSITYILQPKRTGKLIIPAAVAKDADGHKYQSNSVTVQVVPGSLMQQQQQDPYNAYSDPWGRRRQQMQAARQKPQVKQLVQSQTADLKKDLFVKVSVDKSKVHVGEQITASYKLYTRVPMNVSISKLPSLNGFWTQDFELPKKNVKPVEEFVNGRKYQVFLLKKSALFPQQTGTLELDPAQADGIARVVQQIRQRHPFADMFEGDPNFQNAVGSLMMNDPFFNDDAFSTMVYKDVKVSLKSTPLKVNVTPLPLEGKPANYGGAVGNFNVSGKLDKTELTTDDVLTYKLVINGSGNLKLIEAPKLNLPNGLNTYDPQTVDTITGRSTTISGSKIITYAISPNTPGDYTIPAIDFTYFNPQSGKYVTLQTQPTTVHVKQGKNYQKEVRNTALADIHDIKTAPLQKLNFKSKPLVHTVGYWSMYAVPVMAFVGLAFWRRREEELSKDIVKLKNKRANKIALKRLAAAEKLLQQNSRKPFYEEVSKAIWLYLSDKLNIPLSSLSREQAQQALTSRNIPTALQQQIENVMNECETALYAPIGGAQQMNQTYAQAVDVISKLEDSF